MCVQVSGVRLREMLLTNDKLARKAGKLEKRVSYHDEILIEIIHEISTLVDIPKSKFKINQSALLRVN